MKSISMLILLIVLSITSASGQQREFNQVTRSFETVATSEQQPDVVEVPLSKKQIILGIAATAGIAICERFRKCNGVLNTIRNLLVPYQSNPEPEQNFDRSTQRSNRQTRRNQLRSNSFPL